MPVTRKEFEAVFPRLVQDMKDHCKMYNLPDQSLKWFENVRNRAIQKCKKPALTDPQHGSP